MRHVWQIIHSGIHTHRSSTLSHWRETLHLYHVRQGLCHSYHYAQSHEETLRPFFRSPTSQTSRLSFGLFFWALDIPGQFNWLVFSPGTFAVFEKKRLWTVFSSWRLDRPLETLRDTETVAGAARGNGFRNLTFPSLVSGADHVSEKQKRIFEHESLKILRFASRNSVGCSDKLWKNKTDTRFSRTWSIFREKKKFYYRFVAGAMSTTWNFHLSRNIQLLRTKRVPEFLPTDQLEKNTKKYFEF